MELINSDNFCIISPLSGLWDVLTNEEVSTEIRKAADEVNKAEPRPEIFLTQMAKHLVQLARGQKKEGYWEKADGSLASGDDISVFVIPLEHFKTTKIDRS